ncbi:TonB-dependent receptor [Pontixanthobacter gangjinensis]|uniref:TonB-dependent receptor n=1 Tax=Christiangramia aestuarii TaxID=1028746 RepID=A0A7K1LPE1_9FLAO|nr:TonB-dependent receptor [Christiangramia aestuarii]MUP42608.1 TonB-dependent receptor [Christiangramia aestuarii]
MNWKLYYLFTLIACCCLSATAQNDSINWLDEVRLSDVKLKTNSEGQFVKKLDDSLIQRSEPLLTSLLKFNSPFYFRENGYGMVSSASVRGTGAAQTAVIWNGININSQFTGQTDFNTVNTRVFDNISLRPGGGSVVYGSGAIAGTIHLNNEFEFNGESNNLAAISYGSFETIEGTYTGSFSSEKTSVNIGLAGISSENDYPYPGFEARNENGDFSNISLNASIAHWLGKAHILKLYSNYYKGDRGFSGTLSQPSNSKYEDRNARNLLEWKSFLGKFTSSLKLAWLDENFKYYENRDSYSFSYGKAQTAIFKYDLKYELSDAIEVDLIADYTNIDGEGTGIADAHRKIGGVAVLWSHELHEFSYDLSLRQEFSDIYESPLLFSAGAGYRFSENYLLRFNTSRNFRMPTFNDLFWREGGNQDLQPETSLQAEIGNNFSFGELDLNLTAYYIDINNLIRWVPDESGVWRPLNTAEVYNYGAEIFSSWRIQVGGNPLILSANYAFTRSIDRKNGKQLIYTPKHKAGFSTGYSFNGFTLLLESLYNGSIYTSSDNRYELNSYKFVNLGLNYSFSNTTGVLVGFQINNIFNEEYQSLPSRIMPGRSIKSTLTIKF